MNIQLLNPPVFHYSGARYRMLPTIGLPTLVSVLNRAGHTCEGIDLEALCISPEALADRYRQQRELWPDAVGVTGLSITARGMEETVKALRTCGFAGTIFAGGVYATLHPERVLGFGADLVVTGECEGNIVQLLESGATGIQEGQPADIADIPAPDWNHWMPFITSYEGNIRSMMMPNPSISMWSRGCPFRCIFCANPIFGGRKTRYRPAQAVIDEMTMLARLGAERCNVYDDELVGTKLPDGWMHDIADGIEHLGIRWITQGRCSTRFVTDELLRDMKRAGCQLICWGVESFSEPLLEILHKGTDRDDIITTLRRSHDAGIANGVFTMIGNYRESEYDRAVTCEFLGNAYRNGLIQMRQTTICTPMEGTRFGELAKEEGWYDPPPEAGPQMLQLQHNPWLTPEQADYWMRAYRQACPPEMV